MWKLTETKGLKDLSELAAKTATNDVRDSFAGAIKEQLEHGYFDMYEPQILEAYRGMGSDGENLLANVRNIPFREFFDRKHGKISEFLASSGTTGIAGAYYLIPVKLYTELQTCAQAEDIVARISKSLLGPEQLGSGTTCKIDIAKDGQFMPQPTSSGAIARTETMQTVQATLDFTNVYAMNIRITNDLIEDSQFELMQLHVQEAGKAIGEKATDLAVYILTGTQKAVNVATAADFVTDGDGTMNGGLGGDADETKLSGATIDVMDGFGEVVADDFIPDTIVTHPHAMAHSIWTTAPNYGEPFVGNIVVNGLPTKLLGCDVIYTTVTNITAQDSSDAPAEGVATAIFDKDYAILSGRKRWMRVENYSEPVRDLSGAVVSFRQDTVNVYADSVATIVETD